MNFIFVVNYIAGETTKIITVACVSIDKDAKKSPFIGAFKFEYI